MRNHIPKIQALHRAIISNLFHREPMPKWDYNRLTQTIDLLARLVHDYPSDPNTEAYELWNIGEFTEASLDSLIVGAYWHFSQWHEGQWSDSYRALCSLGTVFSPGMGSGPEPDSSEFDVFRELNNIAKRRNGLPVYSFATIEL